MAFPSLHATMTAVLCSISLSLYPVWCFQIFLIYLYTGPMLITGSPIGPSVALWRDPAVWLCAGIVVTVLVVQGVRVGLVNIVSRKWRHWSWQQSYLSSSKDRDQLTHHDGGSDVD